MAKYSEEFKLKVVLDYLHSALSYQLIAKKHQVRAESQVRRWVRAYKEFGRKGLAVKKKKATYSVQFKVDVLHFMKQTGASYQDTAVQFKLNNPSLIAKWNSTFLKEGIEGLQEKVKGRPSMSKKPKPIDVEKPL